MRSATYERWEVWVMSLCECAKNDIPGRVLAYQIIQREEREVVSGVPTIFRCDCKEGWFPKGRYKKVPTWNAQRFSQYTTDPFSLRAMSEDISDASSETGSDPLDTRGAMQPLSAAEEARIMEMQRSLERELNENA